MITEQTENLNKFFVPVRKLMATAFRERAGKEC
jgi:hypothetical protein